MFSDNWYPMFRTLYFGLRMILPSVLKPIKVGAQSPALFSHFCILILGTLSDQAETQSSYLTHMSRERVTAESCCPALIVIDTNVFYFGGNHRSPLSGARAQPFSGATSAPVMDFGQHLILHGMQPWHKFLCRQTCWSLFMLCLFVSPEQKAESVNTHGHHPKHHQYQNKYYKPIPVINNLMIKT